MKKRNGEEEEEKERLINEEYVNPSAAGELLHKFPDKSAFDFDYSQSGIWSPPMRRPFRPIDFSDSDPATPMPRRTLCYGRNRKLRSGSSRSSGLRRKTKKKLSCCGNLGFSFFTLNLFNLKKKHPISEFSPIPPSARVPPKPNKGCGKVLKAAAKHFKKKKKKKDPSAHVKLSDYFIMDPN